MSNCLRLATSEEMTAILLKTVEQIVPNLKQQLQLTQKLTPNYVLAEKRININSFILLYRGFWIVVWKYPETECLDSNNQQFYKPLRNPWAFNIFLPSGRFLAYSWEDYPNWRSCILPAYNAVDGLIEKVFDAVNTGYF